MERIRYTIAMIIRFITRFLRPLKIYHVFHAEYLNSSYEDPSCPSRWKGSGCFDIDIHSINYHRTTVCAESIKEAIAAVERYEKETIENIMKIKQARNPGIPRASLISSSQPYGNENEIIGAIATDEKPDIWDERGDVLDTESGDEDALFWTRDEQTPSLQEAISTFKNYK